MSRIDEVDLVLIINGKIVNLSKEDERRVKILSRKYWDDSIPENPLENDVIIDDRTEEEIENFCLELPRYKRPKQIIFHEIPRNATGKIEKPKLREMYGADKLVEKENEA